ncbi:hypothetical protein [Silicimonas algicola]|uniref:hypothetical protein n=1 Tax=Silicimonas algicola TaxID=1826607 RepID=UPI0011B1F09B|nr:hypothetical protein [Silicimonas algicola]
MIALWLILTQAKIVAPKLVQLERPMLLVWLDAKADAFLQAWAANKAGEYVALSNSCGMVQADRARGLFS